jgi:hypothetical protein
MGYFSKCDEWCDDCFWFEHWTKDVLDLVKGISKTFVVNSKTKAYTYYSVCEKSLQAVIAAKRFEIAEYRRNEKDRIEKIIG